MNYISKSLECRELNMHKQRNVYVLISLEYSSKIMTCLNCFNTNPKNRKCSKRECSEHGLKKFVGNFRSVWYTGKYG